MDGSILSSLVGAKTESILLPHSTPTQGYSREQLGRYQVSKFATYDVDSFLCQINICKGKVHFEKACFRPFLENVLKSYNVHCEENCFKIVAVSRFQNYFAKIQKSNSKIQKSFRKVILKFKNILDFFLNFRIFFLNFRIFFLKLPKI